MASVVIEDKDIGNARIIEQKWYPVAVVKEILPFRIRITDKDIIGFSVANTPPIPLQIIGLSNYIL